MIIDINEITSGPLLSDVAVVGAGPVGIATAFELERRGLDVLLIDSGLESFDDSIQRFSDLDAFDPLVHARAELAMRRQIGGTSTIWGGRCVPYDPIDFEERPIIGDVQWPISYQELADYFVPACRWLECGRPVFNVHSIPHLDRDMIPGLREDDVLTSSLERWSLPTNFGQRYHKDLVASSRIRVLPGLTCRSIECERGSGRAQLLRCVGSVSHRELAVRAEAFVVACGGLESTRLLLSSEGPNGGTLGNQGEHLGRWYMSHVDGIVADLKVVSSSTPIVYDFECDVDGTYVHRRLSFSDAVLRNEQLPNIVGWLTNPEMPDVSHGSSQLSLSYLLLSSAFGQKLAPEALRLSLTGNPVPGTPYGCDAVRSSGRSHVLNIARHPDEAVKFALGYGIRKVAGRGRRAPGFVSYRPDRRYPLEYHGEQIPNYSSRVYLSEKLDSLGMRRLNVDLRFTEQDVELAVSAHKRWDSFFRRSRLGYLEYRYADLHEAIGLRLGGGFHQVGTTRMSASPARGVVDSNLAVHGTSNVYVASSSVFPTSGQANSTFMTVVLGVRLAEHLRGQLR